MTCDNCNNDSVTIDPYDLDTSLAPIIANGLKQHIQLQKEDAYASFPDCFNNEQEWLDVLYEMLYAFDNYDGPNIEDYDVGLEWHETGTTPEGHKQMEITVKDEQAWTKYKFDCEEHEERITKGLSLFSRFYRSLWL